MVVTAIIYNFKGAELLDLLKKADSSENNIIIGKGGDKNPLLKEYMFTEKKIRNRVYGYKKRIMSILYLMQNTKVN